MEAGHGPVAIAAGEWCTGVQYTVCQLPRVIEIIHNNRGTHINEFTIDKMLYYVIIHTYMHTI